MAKEKFRVLALGSLVVMRLAWAILAASILLSLPASAGETVHAMGADLRLIAGATIDGTANLGLAIDLAPGWKTYWRYPGDSGVPPDIDTGGSTNVAALKIDFPAPQRFGVPGDQSIGYHDPLMLLLNARLIDPAKPAVLKMVVRLGICREVCVPVEAEFTQPMSSTAKPDAKAAEALRAAAAQLPQPVIAGADYSVTGLKRDPATRPEMVSIKLKAPADQLADVFVEGPAGWALPLPTRISAAGDTSLWQFALDGLPGGAVAKGARLTVTIVGKSRATTQSVILE